jgi:hypothetical protein
MGKVVELSSYRPQSWINGTMLCTACKYEWVGVCPVGRKDGIECPLCGTERAVLKYPVVPETYVVCSCGGELFYITPEGAMCRECGEDLDL